MPPQPVTKRVSLSLSRIPFPFNSQVSGCNESTMGKPRHDFYAVRANPSPSALSLRIRRLLLTRVPTWVFLLLFLLSVIFSHASLSSWMVSILRRDASFSEPVHIAHGRVDPREDATKAAVAVCIAGQMRTFRLFPVRLSILYHVLEPLRDAGHPVHVFFHVASGDISKSDFKTSPSTNLFMPFAPATLTTFPVTPRCPVKPCPIPRDTGCPHTLLRADECMMQVRAFERHTNVTFAWIYRTRPDIVIATNISLPSQLPDDLTLYTNMHEPFTNTYAHPWLRQTFPYSSRLLHDPVGDLVHIVPRRLAAVVFSASQAFQDCHLFHMPNGTITPEVALTYWLAKHAVTYRPMPWLWMLVRQYSGPECAKIPFIYTGNSSTDEQYMRTCLSYKRTGVLPPL